VNDVFGNSEYAELKGRPVWEERLKRGSYNPDLARITVLCLRTGMTDVCFTCFSPVEVQKRRIQMIDSNQRPIDGVASIERPKPAISRGIFSDSAA